MVRCVLSQLKPSGFFILSCENGLGLRPRIFFTAKNGELHWLHLIRKTPLKVFLKGTVIFTAIQIKTVNDRSIILTRL